MNRIITRLQCKMARAALSFELQDLAQEAGVSLSAVQRFENSGVTNDQIAKTIRDTLMAAGIEFIPEDNNSEPGIQLAKREGWG
jgi:transcriptional regulator with XRE-family HTH domain